MEYYSATKNNDMGFEGEWMQLEDIMLSEARIRNTKEACVEDRSKEKHIHTSRIKYKLSCRTCL
jgi:hypothetical protein